MKNTLKHITTYQSIYISLGLLIVNMITYMFFPMPGYRRWDGLMTATAITHFAETPWETLLFFAHTLVIPLTKVFQFISPDSDPLMITTFRETIFSSANTIILFWFVKTITSSQKLGALVSLIYIFSHGHWMLSSGGEEKDLLLFFNMLYVIGVFQFFHLPGRPNIQLPKWIWPKHRPLAFPIFLGCLFSLSVMVHLENGLLMIPTVGLFIYMMFVKQSLGDIWKEFSVMIMTASVLLIAWFGFLIIGVNHINTSSEAMRWLFEYHATGEFFDTGNGIWEQSLKAYKGFHYFLIGEQLLGWTLVPELILVLSLVLLSFRNAFKQYPEMALFAGINIGVIAIHFFYWVPDDPEQWIPVYFAGVIVFIVGIQKSWFRKAELIALILFLIIFTFNVTEFREKANYYRPYRMQAENVSRVGFGSFHTRNMPDANIARWVFNNTEPGSLIICEKRHMMNHLLIYTDLKPVYPTYLEKTEEELRNRYYLSQLSMEYYVSDITIKEISNMISSGETVYYLLLGNKAGNFQHRVKGELQLEARMHQATLYQIKSRTAS